MEAGQKLKAVRERLGLRYREVEQASLVLAEAHKNDEYAVALSRLSDIENKGTVPSFFRLYSLCAIYRLDLLEVLKWYGVDATKLPGDALRVEVNNTHTIGFETNDYGSIQIPLTLDPGIDLRKTIHLSRLIQRWGSMPLMLLNALDMKKYRYGLIGMDDWWMHPILQPGALVLIDESRRKLGAETWTNEHDRPIFFFEHRLGFLCSWCTLEGETLTLQPHPSSIYAPKFFSYPGEIDIIGQVTGVAMRLGPGRRRRSRF